MKRIHNQVVKYKFVGNYLTVQEVGASFQRREFKNRNGELFTLKVGDIVNVEDFILPCKLGTYTQSTRYECPGCAKIEGIDSIECFKYDSRYGLQKVNS